MIVKKAFLDNEISIRELTLIFWKEKFLLLIIVLIFTVSGYVYGSFKPKVYKSVITIRQVPSYLFLNSLPLNLNIERKRHFFVYDSWDYNDEFILNFQTLSHFENFVRQNTKINKLKSYLANNNISISSFFQNKIQIIIDKKNNKIITINLTFSQPLLPIDFLNDYILYIQEVTINFFKQDVVSRVKKAIELYDHYLGISEKLKLNDYFFQSLLNSDPKILYDIQFQQQQKIYLINYLKEMESFNINFNPILNKSIKPALVTKSPYFFMLVAFMIGLIFSSILIFFKSNLSR